MSEYPLAVNLLDVTRSLILGRVHLNLICTSFGNIRLHRSARSRMIQRLRWTVCSITWSKTDNLCRFSSLVRWYFPYSIQSKQRAFFHMHLLFSQRHKSSTTDSDNAQCTFLHKQRLRWMFNFGLSFNFFLQRLKCTSKSSSSQWTIGLFRHLTSCFFMFQLFL